MATPLAQASTSSNFTRQPPSAKSDVVDIPALQSASRVLLEQLAKDAQIIPDIGETLTTRMSYFCLYSNNPNAL
jgi:nuclear pore complex protein Nup155